MDNIFDFTLLFILGGSSILAFFGVLTLLFPRPIESIRSVLEVSGGRSLLLGLVNFIFFGLLVVLCAWGAERAGRVLAGILVLIGSLIAVVLAALILIGLVGLAQLLGLRISKEASPFVTILRGGGLLLLAGLAPYVGWFLLMPLAIWAGLGASIQVFIPRRKPKAVEEK